MFEIKVGRLMVKEVTKNNSLPGHKYEFVNIESFSNLELSKIGKELIDNSNLVIAFMDYVEDDKNKELDECSYFDIFKEDALNKVNYIVNKATSKNGNYYYDNESHQYRPHYELGTMIWNMVMKYDSCFVNLSSVVDSNPKYKQLMQYISKNLTEFDFEQNTTKSCIFHTLKNCLEKHNIKDISNWNINNYLCEFSPNGDMYQEMMSAVDAMINDDLIDTAIWNEDELLWEVK